MVDGALDTCANFSFFVTDDVIDGIIDCWLIVQMYFML
jgi:hypothetical protein